MSETSDDDDEENFVLFGSIALGLLFAIVCAGVLIKEWRYSRYIKQKKKDEREKREREADDDDDEVSLDSRKNIDSQGKNQKDAGKKTAFSGKGNHDGKGKKMQDKPQLGKGGIPEIAEIASPAKRKPAVYIVPTADKKKKPATYIVPNADTFADDRPQRGRNEWEKTILSPINNAKVKKPGVKKAKQKKDGHYSNHFSNFNIKSHCSMSISSRSSSSSSSSSNGSDIEQDLKTGFNGHTFISPKDKKPVSDDSSSEVDTAPVQSKDLGNRDASPVAEVPVSPPVEKKHQKKNVSVPDKNGKKEVKKSDTGKGCRKRKIIPPPTGEKYENEKPGGNFTKFFKYTYDDGEGKKNKKGKG